MLARGALIKRRPAVGVANVRGALQYVTAVGIVVADTETVVDVRIAMEGAVAVRLVVGLSLYVDNEFATDSAVATIDHPGTGTVVATLGARGSPYVTLVLVGGAYAGRVDVTVMCESGGYAPPPLQAHLPTRMLALRKQRGAALVSVPESLHAAPGCFVVQQSKQMCTSVFVVELTELDGSKHDLVSGDVSILDVSSRLSVTVSKYLDTLGRWTGFVVRVTEPGWEKRGARDHRLTYTVVRARAARGAGSLALALTDAEQTLCLLAPLRLVPIQPAVYAAGTTRAQYVRFKPALYDRLWFATSGPGLECWKDDEDSFVAKDEQSRAASPSVELTIRRPMASERAVDDASAILSVEYVAETAMQVLSVSSSLVVVTNDVHCFDAGGSVTGTKLVEQGKVKVSVSVDGDAVLVAKRAFGAIVRSPDGMWDAVDEGGEPMFVERVEGWMLDPPVEVVPNTASVLARYGTKFYDASAPARNAKSRYRVAHSGAINVRVDGPSVLVDGTVFDVRASPRLELIGGLSKHVLVADASSPIFVLGGQSYRANGTPSPLGHKGLLGVAVPAQPTTLRGFDASAPPEPASALLASKTYGSVRLFLVDARDGTLRTALSRTTLSLAGVTGGTVSSVRWSSTTIDGASVWFVEMSTVVPAVDATAMRVGLQITTTVSDARYAAGLVAPLSGTIYADVPVVAQASLSCAIYDDTRRGVMHVGRKAKLVLSPEGVSLSPWERAVTVHATCVGYATSVFDDDLYVTETGVHVVYEPPKAASSDARYTTVKLRLEGSFVVVRGGVAYRAPYAAVETTVKCGPEPSVVQLDDNGDGTAKLTLRDATMRALTLAPEWSDRALRGLAKRGQNWVLPSVERTVYLEAVEVVEGGYFPTSRVVRVYASVRAVPSVALVFSARGEDGVVELRFEETSSGTPLVPVTAVGQTVTITSNGQNVSADVRHYGLSVGRRALVRTARAPGAVRVGFGLFEVKDEAGRRCSIPDCALPCLVAPMLVVTYASLRLDVPSRQPAGLVIVVAGAGVEVEEWGSVWLVDSQDTVHAFGAFSPSGVTLLRSSSSRPDAHEPLYVRLVGAAAKFGGAKLADLESAAIYATAPVPYTARVVRIEALGALVGVYDAAGARLRVGESYSGAVFDGYVRLGVVEQNVRVRLEGQTVFDTLRVFWHALVGPRVSGNIVDALEAKQVSQNAVYELVDHEGKQMSVKTCSVTTALPPPYRRSDADGTLVLAANAGKLDATVSGLYGVAASGTRDYEAHAIFLPTTREAVAVCTASGVSDAFAARVKSGLTGVLGTCDVGRAARTTDVVASVRGTTSAPDLALVDRSGRVVAAVAQRALLLCRVVVGVQTVDGAEYQLRYSSSLGSAVRKFAASAGNALTHGTWAVPIEPGTSLSASTISCGVGRVEINALLPLPTVKLDGVSLAVSLDAGRWLVRHALSAVDGATYVVAYFGGVVGANFSVVASVGRPTEFGTMDEPVQLGPEDATARCGVGRVTLVLALPCVASVHRVPTAKLDTTPLVVALSGTRYVAASDFSAAAGTSYVLEYMADATTKTTIRSSAGGPTTLGTNLDPVALGDAAACGVGSIQIRAVVQTVVRYFGALGLSGFEHDVAYVEEGVYDLRSERYASERATVRILAPCPAQIVALVQWSVAPSASVAAKLALAMRPNYACEACVVTHRGSGYATSQRVTVAALGLESAFTLSGGDIVGVESEIAFATPAVLAARPPAVLCVTQLLDDTRVSPALSKPSGTAVYRFHPHARCTQVALAGATLATWAAGAGTVRVAYTAASGTQLTATLTLDRVGYASTLATATTSLSAAPASVAYTSSTAVEFRDAGGQVCVFQGNRVLTVMREVEYEAERRFVTASSKLAEICIAVGDTATVQSIGDADLLDESGRIVATYVGGSASLTGLERGKYALRRRSSGAAVPVHVRSTYVHAGAATVRGLVTFDGGGVETIAVPAYPAGGLLTSWSGQQVWIALGGSSAVDATLFTGTGASVPMTLFCTGVARLNVVSVTSVTVSYFAADGSAVGASTSATGVTTTGFTMPSASSTVASAEVRVVAKVQQQGASGQTDVDVSRVVAVYKRPEKYCVVFGTPPAATATYEESKQRAARQWPVKTASTERVFVVFDTEVAVAAYEVQTSPAYTRGSGAASVAFLVRDGAGTVEADVVSVSVDGAPIARVASVYTIDASVASVVRVEVRVAGTHHVLFLGERPVTLSVAGSSTLALSASRVSGSILEFVGLPPTHNGNYGFAIANATIEAGLPDSRRCGARFSVTAEHSGTHELSSMVPLSDVTCTFTCTDAVPRQGSTLKVRFTSTSKGALECEFAQVSSIGAASVVSRALEIVVADDYVPRASVDVISATLVSDKAETLLCSTATLDVSTVRYLGLPRFAWQTATAHALTGGAVLSDVRFRAACVRGTSWSGATLEVRLAADDTLLGSATVSGTTDAYVWAVSSLEVARRDGSQVYVAVSKGGQTWRLGASGSTQTLRAPLVVADVEGMDSTSDEVTMTEIEYTISGTFRSASVSAVTSKTSVRETPSALVNPKWKLFHEEEDAATATLAVALVDSTGRSTAKDVRVSLALRAPLSFTLDDEHVATLRTPRQVHAAVLRADRELGGVTAVTAVLEDATEVAVQYTMHDASTVICCVPSAAKAVESITATAYLRGESAAKRRQAIVHVGADKPTSVASRVEGAALGATIVVAARTGYIEGLPGVWLLNGGVVVREAGIVYATGAMQPSVGGTVAMALVVRGASCYVVLGGESAVGTRQSSFVEPTTRAGACSKLCAGAPFAAYGFGRLLRFARGVAATSVLQKAPALALDDPLVVLCGLSVGASGIVVAHVEGVTSVEVLATATATMGVATSLVSGFWRAASATPVACVRVSMGSSTLKLWPRLEVELTMCTGTATGCIDMPSGSCVVATSGVSAIGAVDVAGAVVSASKISLTGKAIAVAATHAQTQRYVGVVADSASLRVAPPLVYRVASDASIVCHNLTADARGKFVAGVRNVVYVEFDARAEIVAPWHTEGTASVDATADGASCTVLFVRTAPFGVWLRFDAPAKTSVPLVLELKAPGGVSLRPVSTTLDAAARAVGYDASATEVTMLKGGAAAVLEVPSAQTRVTSAVTVTVVARLWRNSALERNAGFCVRSATLLVALRNEGATVAVDVSGRTVRFDVADAGDGLRVVTARVAADSVLLFVDGVSIDRAISATLLSGVPDFVLEVSPTAIAFSEARAAVAAVWVAANETKEQANATHEAARVSARARDTRRAVVRPSKFHNVRYADSNGTMVTTAAAVVGALALEPSATYIERRYDSSAAPTSVAAVRVSLEAQATVTLVSADTEAGVWTTVETWTLPSGVRVVNAPKVGPSAWHAVRVAGGRALSVHAELVEPSARVAVTMLAPTLAFVYARDASVAARALATLDASPMLGTDASGGLSALGMGTACVVGGVSGKTYVAASPVPPYVAMTSTTPPAEDGVRFSGVTDAEFDALSGFASIAVRCEWLGTDGPVLEFETWSAEIRGGKLCAGGAETGAMRLGVAHEITVVRVSNDARIRLDHRWPVLVRNGTCALRRLGSTTGAARLWLLRCGDPVTRCVPLAAASDTLTLTPKVGASFVYGQTSAPVYVLVPALTVAPRHAAVRIVDGATSVVFVVTQTDSGHAPLQGRLSTAPASNLAFESDGSVTATAQYGTGMASFKVLFDGETRAECGAPVFYFETTTLGAAVATALGNFTLATSTTHTTLEIPVRGIAVAWASVVAGTHTNAAVKSCSVSGSKVTCEARALAAGSARLAFDLVGPDGARVAVGCDVAASAVLDVPTPTWEVIAMGALTKTCVVRTKFAFGGEDTARAAREAIGATASTALEAYMDSTYAVTAASFECTRVVSVAGRALYEFKKTLTCGYDPSAVRSGNPSATHGLAWPLMVGAEVVATWTISNAPAWTLKSVAMRAGFTGALSATTASGIAVRVAAAAVPASNATVATATLVGPEGTEFDVALAARPEDVGVVPWAGNFKTSWTQRAVVGSRTEVSVVFEQIAALGECTCAFASTGQSFTSTSDASSGVFRAHFAPTASGTHTVTATMRLGKLGLERVVTCAVAASVAVPASMASATVQYTWDGTTLSGGEGVTTIASAGLQVGGTYARVRRSGQERPTSVATFFTLDLSEAGDAELLARGYCREDAPSGRALQAAETALGLDLRTLYVRGHATPVGPSGNYVKTLGSGVLVYRIPERDYVYSQPSCYVIVVDTDATPSTTDTMTLFGVAQGGDSGDPEILYDGRAGSTGVWVQEQGNRRSVRAVRHAGRIVCQNRGRAGSNRLYSMDATTGVRSESNVNSNATGGTTDGWLSVSVHPCVTRAAFFWGEATPDVEALLYVPPPMSSQPGLRSYASIGDESGAWLGAYSGSDRSRGSAYVTSAALSPAESALGMRMRFVYVRGLATPMVGAKGAGEFVQTQSNVKEFRLEEPLEQPSCFVLVVDVDLAAVRALATTTTLVGVYSGASVGMYSGDPELVYDHSSDDVWAYESSGKRSDTSVRGTRLVYKVKGDGASSNRLYAIDATTGSRTESTTKQSWTTGTNGGGWLHVCVHEAVQRVSFVWANLGTLPDVEALVATPTTSVIALPKTGASCAETFVHYNTSAGQSFVQRLGGRRVGVPYVAECGTTAIAGVHYVDHWASAKVKSAVSFASSSGNLELPAAWGSAASPLWPAGKLESPVTVAAAEYAAWVAATFDGSMVRPDGSAVPTARGGLLQSAANDVARWLTPTAKAGIVVESDGWFVRWGYQRPQIVRRVALGAAMVHSGCTFELRGCTDRNFGSGVVVATATTVGTAEKPVWTTVSRIMAYTHFEFVHVSGTAQQGLFFLRLGE